MPALSLYGLDNGDSTRARYNKRPNKSLEFTFTRSHAQSFQNRAGVLPEYCHVQHRGGHKSSS